LGCPFFRPQSHASTACHCGYAGDSRRACVCLELEITKYRRKLSGPPADRIEMHVTRAPVSLELMGDLKHGDASRDIRARVERARAIQRRRYGARSAVAVNAMAARRTLWRDLDQVAKAMLSSAAETLALSARGFDRVLRVARTTADLEESDGIMQSHMAEAIRYRPR
jgi:magnesium chelatase family protein